MHANDELPHLDGGNGSHNNSRSTITHRTTATTRKPSSPGRRVTRLSASRNHTDSVSSCNDNDTDNNQSGETQLQQRSSIPDSNSGIESPRTPQRRQSNLRKSSLSITEVHELQQRHAEQQQQQSHTQANQQNSSSSLMNMPSLVKIVSIQGDVEIPMQDRISVPPRSPRSPRRNNTTHQHHHHHSKPTITTSSKKSEKCDYFAVSILTGILLGVLIPVIIIISDITGSGNSIERMPGRRILSLYPGDSSPDEYEANVRLEFVKRGTDCRLRIYHFANGTQHSECIDDTEKLLPIGHQSQKYLANTLELERTPKLIENMRWIDMCNTKTSKIRPTLTVPFYIQCMKCMFPLSKYINQVNLLSEITKHYSICWGMYQTHAYIRMYSTNHLLTSNQSLTIHMNHLSHKVFTLEALIPDSQNATASPSFGINMHDASSGKSAVHSTLIMTYYRNISSITFNRQLFFLDNVHQKFDQVHSLFVGKTPQALPDLLANEL